MVSAHLRCKKYSHSPDINQKVRCLSATCLEHTARDCIVSYVRNQWWVYLFENDLPFPKVTMKVYVKKRWRSAYNWIYFEVFHSKYPKLKLQCTYSKWSFSTDYLQIIYRSLSCSWNTNLPADEIIALLLSWIHLSRHAEELMRRELNNKYRQRTIFHIISNRFFLLPCHFSQIVSLHN